jgi:hypothetical protein
MRSAAWRTREIISSQLNAAVREGLIADNPLAQVRLAKPVRPHAVIWADERVTAWRRDGIRPPVAVWTLRQLITFLAGVENDRLAALWWLIALHGLGTHDQPAARRAAGGAVLRAAEEPCQHPDHRPARTMERR